MTVWEPNSKAILSLLVRLQASELHSTLSLMPRTAPSGMEPSSAVYSCTFAISASVPIAKPPS